MADTVGNTLGPRATFAYITDSGETVSVTLDRSVSASVGNTEQSNPGRPISVNSRYLSGRYILVQAVDDASIKKRIIIGNPNNTFFNSDQSQTVSINGRQFITTGRVGEKASFLRDTTGLGED